MNLTGATDYFYRSDNFWCSLRFCSTFSYLTSIDFSSIHRMIYRMDSHYRQGAFNKAEDRIKNCVFPGLLGCLLNLFIHRGEHDKN